MKCYTEAGRSKKNSRLQIERKTGEVSSTLWYCENLPDDHVWAWILKSVFEAVCRALNLATEFVNLT